MKTLIIALCLVSTCVFAQDSQRVPLPPQRRMPPQPVNTESTILPENYLLTLIVSDKDQPVGELALVVATADFTANTTEPLLRLHGILIPDDKDGFLVHYDLCATVEVSTKSSSSEYRDSSVKASVKVRIGEPVQIWKSGSRTYKLTISRLPEEPRKSK